MNAQRSIAPAVIKRKKVTINGRHQGGAWKVAYADFVTAMMAFFLLMWLLKATTEQQRMGIAAYFSPSIPIAKASGGGNGAFGGDSQFSEDVLPQNGTGATDRHPTNADRARGETGFSERAPPSGAPETAEGDQAFRMIEEALAGRGGESELSDESRRHIVTRVTDEGLIIEIFDTDDMRLFESGRDAPTPLMEELIELIASVSNLVENPVAVGAHTRSEPVVLASDPVWPVSSARASRARRMLGDSGLAPDRLRRVTGHADRTLKVENPMAVRNNRVEIILLRSDQPGK